MFRIGADAILTSKHTRTRVEVGSERMETLNSEILSTLVLGGGLGTLLMWIAQRYDLLEQRREARCPACGRVRRRGICACND